MSPRKELRLGFPGTEKKVQADVPEGLPEPWSVDAQLDRVGKDHPRIDGILKVTGAAKYTYDIRRPNLAYAKLIRSPHAAAIVKSVDLTNVKGMPGVLYTEAHEGKTVRFAGDDVGGICAVSEEVLDDAMRAVKVEYEILPHVVTVEAAQEKDAPPVKRGTGNVVVPGRGGRSGDPEAVTAAHAEAQKAGGTVLERIYRTQVQTHSCLETHGCVCEWDGDKLTVWASTQGTFSVRGAMARQMRIPMNQIEVITEHMGGGFGSKFGVDRWDVFAARAARETKRPVRAMLDRKEEHLAAGNRPSSIQRCKFSILKDGRLMGAGVRSWGTGGIGGGAGVMNPAIYDFKAASRLSHDVYTNAGGGRAFRAPRHPQGIFALSGMIDELAEAIGMDPLEVRKKNDKNPVRLAQYDVGAKAIGWQRRRKKPGSDKGPKKRGLGMASGLWYHTGRKGSVVTCKVQRDGSVLTTNGAQDLGTGTRTVMAILTAEELGLKPSQVQVRLGHTTDGTGPGSGGSTTAASLGPAVRSAAYKVKNEMLRVVAEKVGGEADQMDLKNGKVTGAKRELTFEQACGLAGDPGIEATATTTDADYSLPRFTQGTAGCQFAEVEVDIDTGHVKVIKVVAVQDCGRVIDPLLARSQINGGVIQGVSYALFEDRRLDERTGDMVNPNFLDYRIVGALETPEIEAIPFTVANGINSIGMSGLGEPPTVPTAGAVANAVANAIGTRVRSLPITPDKVLAALRDVS